MLCHGVSFISSSEGTSSDAQRPTTIALSGTRRKKRGTIWLDKHRLWELTVSRPLPKITLKSLFSDEKHQWCLRLGKLSRFRSSMCHSMSSLITPVQQNPPFIGNLQKTHHNTLCSSPQSDRRLTCENGPWRARYRCRANSTWQSAVSSAGPRGSLLRIRWYVALNKASTMSSRRVMRDFARALPSGQSCGELNGLFPTSDKSTKDRSRRSRHGICP